MISLKGEIKEILEKLKDENNYQVDCNDGSAFKELFANEINLLLDYITNLQKENKDLNRMCELYSKSLYNAELTDYKSRIDKAIEYIMTELIDEWAIKNDGYVSGSDLPADAITPLLDILLGDDKE